MVHHPEDSLALAAGMFHIFDRIDTERSRTAAVEPKN